MLTKIGFAVLLVLACAAPVAAACTFHTYMVGGRTVFCQVCCYPNGTCITTCP